MIGRRVWSGCIAVIVIVWFLPRAAMAAQEPLRVACVGDSITQGKANPDHELHHWPRLLQSLFAETHPGRFRVRNFGLSGTMLLRDAPVSYWKSGPFAESLAWAPDVVVINLGTNDALRRDWVPDSEAVQADLEALLKAFRTQNPQARFLLSELSPIFPLHPGYAYSRPGRAQIESAIHRVAEEQDLPCMAWGKALQDHPLWLPDGLHPNTLGNQRIAQVVYTELTGQEAPNLPGLLPQEVHGPAMNLLAGRLDWGHWQGGLGGARGTGLGNRIAGLGSIAPGDFHLRVRLRMQRQAGSGAHFFFDDNVLAFEGDRGKMFRFGPVMKTWRFLYPSTTLWKRGDWIDFEWIRNGEKAWFRIDGVVVEWMHLPGSVQRFGLDPGESTMEVSEWSLKGPWHPAAPSHITQRSVYLPWLDVSYRQDGMTSLSHWPSTTSPHNAGSGGWIEGVAPAGPGPATHYRWRSSAEEPWGPARPWPAALVGWDHQFLRAPSGEPLVLFVDGSPGSPTEGALVLWVGEAGMPWGPELREGDYTVRLLREVGPAWEGKRIQLGMELSDTQSRAAQPDRSKAFPLHAAAAAPRHTGGQPQAPLRQVRFSLAEFEALLPRRDVQLPVVDLDGDASRFVVVDREPGQYLGHVTTISLDDGQTILATYPKGHGRGPIVMKRSEDGGRTWSDRLPTPPSWATSREVPTLHRLVDPETKRSRLILWSGLYPARIAHSEDEGETWSDLQSVGDWGGIVVMGSVIALRDGSYVGMFHDDGRFFGSEPHTQDPPVFSLYQTLSRDGGRSWSTPEVIWSGSDLQLCEPGAIRSPDGRTLAVLLRENSRKRNSYVIFSDDEARSWSAPRELPASLTGDRHSLVYARDGRLFASFRDTAHRSSTKGDWVGWVGTWEDLRHGRRGQYRVRFKDNHYRMDCAYPGVVALSDGALVVTTYGHWEAGQSPYILSARFRLAELDALLSAAQAQPETRSK